MRARLFGAVAILALAGGVARADLPPFALDSMISDHAVLQRDKPLTITGSGAPGEAVTVAFGAASARSKADARGRWRAILPAQSLGKPRDMVVTASTGRQLTVRDIVIGDVWLCSGQSNMELPVKAALNADAEIAGSTNAAIRLLTVPHASNPAAQSGFASPVAWAIASPASVAGFSAACYFMARDLQARLKVPMGLIQASWGGSNIEAWMPASALAALPAHKDAIALNALYARDRPAAEAMLARTWQDWWHAKVGATRSPWLDDDGLDWQPVPKPWRDWKTWDVPALSNYNGMVWFDRTVDLTPAQAAQGATLETGQVDEIDQTWVNGKPVGNSFGWAVERSYALAPGLLHAGVNRIVLNIYSAWGLGGMFGPADRISLRLADGAHVPLGEGWRYAIPTGPMPAPPAAPWYAIGGQTGLYNAMIAPIGTTAITGVAWYQGESNTATAGEYAMLLDALKAGWRAQFGAATPFLIVQLPNFGNSVTQPVESGWASMRDAQRRSSARDPQAALVVAIDLGEASELHPPNKQSLGLRLARAARNVVYGEAVMPSGPQAVAATRDGSAVRIRFAGVTGALVTHSDARPIAFELCGAAVGTCQFGEARIAADGVVLTGANAAVATRVRYCWGDAPLCNIYDRDDLPAGPFELPIE